jgi:hypothetical protein
MACDRLLHRIEVKPDDPRPCWTWWFMPLVVSVHRQASASMLDRAAIGLLALFATALIAPSLDTRTAGTSTPTSSGIRSRSTCTGAALIFATSSSSSAMRAWSRPRSTCAWCLATSRRTARRPCQNLPWDCHDGPDVDARLGPASTHWHRHRTA